MKPKKSITLLFCALVYLTNMFSQSSSYGELDYARAVNMAGRQRMLSQKIAKSYLLLTINEINNNNTLAELNSSTKIFKKQLEILTENAETAAVKTSLKKAEALWLEFDNVINSTQNPTNSLKVSQLNTELLTACNDVVINIENKVIKNDKLFSPTHQELIETVNVSGKQRMLSQRICLYYAALKLFPKNKTKYQGILSELINEFDSVINALKLNKHAIKELKEEFNAAIALWKELKTNKEDIINGKYELKSIYITTNDLTTRFNTITGIYQITASNNTEI